MPTIISIGDGVAFQALSNATDAKSSANTALSQASTALTKSSSALSIANSASTSAASTATSIKSHTDNKNNPHSVTAAQAGAVPTSRTVNGKALSSNITLSAGDVGAATSSALSSHTSNTSNPHSVTAAQVGAVPTSRTVNGKALSSNITLSAGDVGALQRGPSMGPTGYQNLSGYSSWSAIYNALQEGLTWSNPTNIQSGLHPLGDTNAWGFVALYKTGNNLVVDWTVTSTVGGGGPVKHYNGSYNAGNGVMDWGSSTAGYGSSVPSSLLPGQLFVKTS